MHHWLANLLGLLLGLTIGGEAVLILLPWLETPAPASISRPAPPRPVVSELEPPARAGPPPTVQAVEMPRIDAPLPRPDMTMPSVIYPDEPNDSAPHKRGTGVAGTGFFVASDGTLVTAAHVVPGCRTTRIASQFIRPANARLIATDTKQDIALLRADHVVPPAMLPVGKPAAAGGRLFVLGYPTSGGPLIPTETWAVLENAQFQPAPTEFIDPRKLIWADAPAIGHGYSGGPMLDPRNGAVVGIVRGMVDSARLHAVRAAIPASGMVIGPGSSPLMALLQQEGADGDALAVSGDDALDAARRATVHVLCLY